MTTILLTILFTLLFLLVFVAVILLSNRSKKELSREDILLLLDGRLEGKESETEWASYLSVPIHHDVFLESVRLQCLRLEHHEQLESSSGIIGRSKLSVHARDQLNKIREELLYQHELRC